MSLVKFDLTLPHEKSSVLTTESVEDIRLATGDDIELVINVIHVLPAKD